ncbi:PREDICTED: scarecrow-like protein 8 isoform X2 [Tarenaya hassleriana]|uniref:scarecrow-like protein 8 isoform X1 n=1 Tax=Tarenaya hassleriana TaxID=28532 RepID=UPI00053C8494|nr:PREDICTED: scarecrow-like protein 8 isoform X1 [Tarenaya hassleriana]XP_010555679.1 PREDICTED: scarecrow-like protein 8 isoform X2 [Tarenaya hassleriana]
MASGFSGGGGPEFFAGGGRSMNSGNNNNSNNPPIPHPSYRNQLPGIFFDQIGNMNSGGHGLAGKRTLADFQAAQFQNPAALNALLLRSVKPRTFQNLPSPISPLLDLTANDINLLGGSSSSTQRFGLPILPHVRSHHMSQTPQPGLGLCGVGARMGFGSGNNTALQGVPCVDSVQNRAQPSQDSEKMMSRLKELEKRLLDDDGDGQGDDDDVSVITNANSEWSETIQCLVNPVMSPSPTPTPTPNPVTSSPSCSSSSSSSSPSAASPMSLCPRQTIMEIATAISEGKTDIAAEILARVTQTPNPKANSEQKVTAFMLSALRSRLNPAGNPAPASELYGNQHLGSIQLLYELSPCFKLGFMAANLSILEATLGSADAVGSDGLLHVVDFDVGQGGQYVNLLHELSTRRNGKVPLVVKITAVVDKGDGSAVSSGGEERLNSVGDFLRQLGERLGITLRFNVVSSVRLGNLSRESLGCDPDEPLAVNLAFKLCRVPDESVCTENPRDELLRRVKALAPRVVTLVEQELNANTAPFLARVSKAGGYYGALLESVESTVPSSNSDRVMVEAGLSRKLVNAVASEGVNRIERCEVFGKWRLRMGMAGFELMPLSQTIAESLRSRLSNGNRVHPGFTVKEDNGGVSFAWMGRTLAVASTWR